jgi:nitrogen regulatory protein PII
MKMFVLVYSDAADEAVTKAFKSADVKGYTKWKEAYGEGTETEPKLGTHYWPGKNNVLAVVIKDEEVERVKDVIRHVKSEHPKAGLKTFILEVEDII